MMLPLVAAAYKMSFSVRAWVLLTTGITYRYRYYIRARVPPPPVGVGMQYRYWPQCVGVGPYRQKHSELVFFSSLYLLIKNCCELRCCMHVRRSKGGLPAAVAELQQCAICDFRPS